jgi:uncharacterized protein (TIRG00374 family)
VKRWRIGLLGVAVSLLAIYFVLSQVDVPSLRAALAEARWAYLLPTVVFLLLGLLTRAARWRLLLSNGLPFRRTFSVMNVAYLVNGVLPLRIGEVARIYLATRAQPPVPPLKTASTIIVERLLDLLAVVLLLLLALAGGPLPEELRAAATVSAIAALSGFAGLVALAGRRGLVQGILRRIMGVVPAWSADSGALAPRLSRWLDHFWDGLQPLAQPGALVLALGWTAASWGFSAVAGYILMFTFYEQASLSATFLYIAAAAFAIAVPAMPANLGPYEASIIVALRAMGYGEPQTTSVAFAVLVHGINLAVHAGTGILGFVQEGISLEQLSRGVREMRHSRGEDDDSGTRTHPAGGDDARPA